MPAHSIMLTFPGAQVLRQTPDVLRLLVASATSEDLDWQPGPDRWSVSMVLAHLADVEVRGMTSRLRAIAGEDNPHLPAYDQLELFRSGKKFDGRAELGRFENERRSVEYVVLGPAQAGDIAPPTPEALAKYFEERKALFRAPEYRNGCIPELLQNPSVRV